MKKFVCILLVLIMIFSLTGCGKRNLGTPLEPNSFVSEGEHRFVLIDAWEEDTLSTSKYSDYTYKVIEDRVTGVLYLFMTGPNAVSGLTPLYCEDGSLMTYDGF